MIETLSVDFRNCYGIGSLVHYFKFNKGVKAQLIYAPNGSMKTSFAKTMRYLSEQSKEQPHLLTEIRQWKGLKY
ncbi:hypothetical protein IX308_000608 [Porphyromonas levii]|nr:hypothetical protein [Porphyromonas levii]